MAYAYPPARAYRLTRDGVEVTRGTEHACWQWLHAQQSGSVDWALRYEGYALVPVEVTSWLRDMGRLSGLRGCAESARDLMVKFPDWTDAEIGEYLHGQDEGRAER